MIQRTWFITGVSSGFGRQLTEQLLERGDRVIGTVRDTGKVADLLERYPDTTRSLIEVERIRDRVHSDGAWSGRSQALSKSLE